MQFTRYSSRTVAGKTGFLAKLVNHNFHCKRCVHVSSIKPVKLDINGIISKEIEMHATKLAPVMKYGFPSYDALRTNERFMLSYDRRNKVPFWVMEHITSNMLVDADETHTSRSSNKFFEDQSIHLYFRGTNEDYQKSNYDRGHLAAAANYKYSQESLDDTFILSNIAPQNYDFNRVIWRALEKRVRDSAKKYGSVYVCSGPLYLPRETRPEDEEIIRLLQGDSEKKKKRTKIKNENGDDSVTRKFMLYEVIGANNVAVPTHFFKIIICEVENEVYDMEAYIIPNQKSESKKPLEFYMVSRDTIERAAGFLLFHNLPTETFRRINGKENISTNSSLKDV